MFNENTWKEGESLALKWMKKHGYKIVFTNYHVGGYELDIVAILPKREQQKVLKLELNKRLKQTGSKAQKQLLKNNYKLTKDNVDDLLVVTEVKARATEKFGSGLDAVSLKKQAHIKRGAEVLLKFEKFKNKNVRFDVASVDAGQVTYVENAF